MTTELSNDELLDVPLGNLTPGELARAFKVEAQHARKIEEIENEHLSRTITVQQSEERKQEEEESYTRQVQLLTEIHEREIELDEEAQRQDNRAIKLADGRRAYVDGDTFRDDKGRQLKGADRAQAEQEHLEHPDATTWQEHENLNLSRLETERLKKEVEGLQGTNDDPNTASKLTAYEKQLQASRDTELAKQPNVPDYGSGDYSADLSGLSGSLQAATPAAGAMAPAAPVQAQLSAKPKMAATPF